MGTKYRLGNQPWYSKGVLHAAGSIVELGDNEKPSRTWTKVKDQKRPSDRVLAFHGDPDASDDPDENPALRPLPDTPPTAKSVGGFIPSAREPDEEPALSPEEQKLDSAKRAEKRHGDRAAQEKLLADKATSEREAAEKAAKEREGHHGKKRPSDNNPL